jgi:hypothetical protein
MLERVHGKSDTSLGAEFKVNTSVAFVVSLGFSDEMAFKLRSQYYTQYGLTLRGLRRHHGVGSTISRPSSC